MTEQEKKYKDGFNSGYFLAEHNPEFIKIIIDSTPNIEAQSEYIQGLAIGHDVYVAERFIAQNKEEAGSEKVEPEKIWTSEERYIKGFNNGYFISQHDPELAQMLITPQENPSEYHQGLTEGKNEYEIEKIQDRLNEISKNKPSKDDKDIDKER